MNRQLLCLSNGHGEDRIALRILQALQQQANAPAIAVLPIVGEGHAYQAAGFPVIGPVKRMPSGGFLYMDNKELVRDLQGGLVQLTLAQRRAIRQWCASEPDSRAILAVGDIVPLLFAGLSRVPYAFVGTAKSEYYLRDEAGWLSRPSWWSDRLQRSTNCIYLPWERWLLSRPRCKAMFARDPITATQLRRFNVPAFDLGNPMMDGLEWSGAHPPSAADAASLAPDTTPLTLVLLPGSRPPEAYANWELILQALNGLLVKLKRPLVALAAIAPGVDRTHLAQRVLGYRWQATAEFTFRVGVGGQRATLELGDGERFAEFLHRADGAIALAGTATEQFVGLGKPAITLPGPGPQFNPQFAEAQTRHLGPSVTLVPEPNQVADALLALLANPDRLQIIAANGRRRMGEPGAAARIAACLGDRLWSD
jgi:uncharacterized protein (TIGR03492 family)